MSPNDKGYWFQYLKHHEVELAGNGRLALVISLSAVAVFWGLGKTDNPFRYHALLASAIALSGSIFFLFSAYHVRQYINSMISPKKYKKYIVSDMENGKKRLDRGIKRIGLITIPSTNLIIAIIFLIVHYFT